MLLFRHRSPNKDVERISKNALARIKIKCVSTYKNIPEYLLCPDKPATKKARTPMRTTNLLRCNKLHVYVSEVRIKVAHRN